MPKLTAKKQYKKNGEKIINSYITSFTKSKIENVVEWKEGEELEAEYLKDKVIIRKRGNDNER